MFLPSFGLVETFDLLEVLDSSYTGFHESHLEILVPVLTRFMFDGSIRVISSWYEATVREEAIDSSKPLDAIHFKVDGKCQYLTDPRNVEESLNIRIRYELGLYTLLKCFDLTDNELKLFLQDGAL